jgi:HAD superfamily hydrolase (TIGR01509 family)
MFSLALRGILLDLDGTLTHFNIDYIGARRAALKRIAEFGVHNSDLTEELSVYNMLKRLRTQLSEQRFRQLKSELYGILEDIENEAAEQVTILPEAKRVMEELKQLGLPIGLVTNNSRPATLRTLQRLSLVGYFDAIITRDDHEEIKPDPGSLLAAAKSLGLKPEEVAFVGDTIIDIQAAHRAGIVAVSVPSGPTSMTRLVEAGPDFLISNLTELPTLIRREIKQLPAQRS